MKSPATPYDQSFFDDLQAGSEASASVIVPEILGLTGARSVIDVGCGEGMWLSVFEQQGISDFLGLDGSYVDGSRLRIAVEKFRPTDLSASMDPDSVRRRFDLVLSLEVGEHLPSSTAQGFVRFLTSLGDCVMFSAAVPGQGGTDHVNEQWPQYWAELFEACGFQSVDCVRRRIWNNPKVAWWYAQNIVLYVKKDALASMSPQLQSEAATSGGPPMAMVHPALFRQAHDCFDSLMESPRVLLSALPKALIGAIRRRTPLSRNNATGGIGQ
jgi:hypothetical protein